LRPSRQKRLGISTPAWPAEVSTNTRMVVSFFLRVGLVRDARVD
jgi:hypothetical protein